jgi:hypothetical protein
MENTFCILASRGQHHDILRLHSRYPLLCLLLYKGGLVFCIFDVKGGAIMHCINLLGSSLCSKYCRNVGGLSSGGCLPRLSHVHQQRRHIHAALG